MWKHWPLWIVSPPQLEWKWTEKVDDRNLIRVPFGMSALEEGATTVFLIVFVPVAFTVLLMKLFMASHLYRSHFLILSAQHLSRRKFTFENLEVAYAFQVLTTENVHHVMIF
jgi:hypothetical protein